MVPCSFSLYLTSTYIGIGVLTARFGFLPYTHSYQYILYIVSDIMTPDGTVALATVDVVKITQVQLAAQDSQLAHTTVERDSSSAADGTVTPAAAPTLAQPAVPDSLLVNPVDTPIKRDSSTLLPFTTLSRFRADTLNSMGREIQDHVVGPMPVEDFLEKFLPNPKDYDPSDFVSRFASASNAEVFNMQSITKEEDSYQPFVSDPCGNHDIEILNSLTTDYRHATLRSPIIVCEQFQTCRLEELFIIHVQCQAGRVRIRRRNIPWLRYLQIRSTHRIQVE